MKSGIHPNYVDTQITCACGNVIETRSTRQGLRVDLCNVCHPFYTGEQRIVDTAGQVERFNKKFERAQASGQAVSKRQQRMTAKSAQMAEEQRRARTRAQRRHHHLGQRRLCAGGPRRPAESRASGRGRSPQREDQL